MLVCAAGDTHGALDRLFADVLDFEATLGVRFAWVLHVGDFGAWPDPSRIDGATNRHEGAGDFPVWWSERRTAPRPTVFIKGNHEDFVWLDAQADPQVLPGLFYLRNGARRALSDGTRSIEVGGLGGCFGPSDFNRPSTQLQRYAKRHYTRDEIDTLIGAGPLDILLVHDAPAGVRFERHHRGAGCIREAAGLDDLLRGTRPRVCFFGHHHSRLDATVHGVPCVGLNKVRMPGNLVAVDIEAGGSAWSIVGEWPPRHPPRSPTPTPHSPPVQPPTPTGGHDDTFAHDLALGPPWVDGLAPAGARSDTSDVREGSQHGTRRSAR